MAITVDGVTYTLPGDIGAIAVLQPYKYELAVHALNSSAADRVWASVIDQQRQRLLPGGGLDVKPPADRRARWEKDIKGIAAPFRDNQGGDNPREFAYWFNYFWAEARTAYDLDHIRQATLCDAFLAVFEDDRQGGFRPRANLADLDDSQKRKILSDIMHAGFKRVPGQPSPEKWAPADAALVFGNVVGDRHRGRPLRLAFRSDSRPWDVLIWTGFAAKARCWGRAVRKANGMEEAWHPFSDPENAQAVFLRKGDSRDNCLFTAVSVAKSLREVMRFPRVDDTHLFSLGRKDPAKWDEKDFATMASHPLGLEIVAGGGRPVDHLKAQQWVYILDVTESRAFDTEAWQRATQVAEPYPEASLESIPPDRFLFLVKVEKLYFFYPNDQMLVLYHVDWKEKRLLWPEDWIEARHGKNVVGAILAQIDDEIAKANAEVAENRRYHDSPTLAAVVAKAREEEKRRARGAHALQAPAQVPHAAAQSHLCSCGKPFPSRTLLQAHKAQTKHV